MLTLTRTPRLTLRTWEPDDLPAFHDIYARWAVMRWLGSHPRRVFATTEEARAALTRWAAATDMPYGLWALVPHDVGHPVGTVLLLPLQDVAGPTAEVEIGWHQHPDHQGRGLVTEAARALLEVAALRRVLALTDPDNERSQAVCSRLGMIDEGLTDRWFGTTLRQYGSPRESGSG